MKGKTRILRVVEGLLSAGDDEISEEALRVAALLARQGDFPARRLLQDPGLAAWLARTRWRSEPAPPPVLMGELKAAVEASKSEDEGHSLLRVAGVLRQFRHRQLLRIFLRELEGASLRQTTAEVADVASCCLELALKEAVKAEGMPELAAEICVFGMGKLGGRELNFSSDVDLIFVISQQGMDQAGPERAETVIRRVVELIDEVTEEGRVFRVDLRLRPDGSRGRLIASAPALVEYYLNWGRGWERSVWLKARPVAGNRALGEAVLKELEPFLYRRHLDFSAIDELRQMKRMIDEETQARSFIEGEGPGAAGGAEEPLSPFKARLLQKMRRRRIGRKSGREQGERQVIRESGGGAAELEGLGGWDVKVGEGGIREIEFFVQALQLVHCGTRPGLRVRNTLEALDRLLYAGLVSASDHEDLSDSYDLFRRLEHLIQMEDDRQDHRLPQSQAEFADLAERMELKEAELREHIELARAGVRRIFTRLFAESPRRSERPTVGEEEESVLERIAGLGAKSLLDEEVIQLLSQAGFTRPRQVAGQLQVLRRKDYGPFSESPQSADPLLARYLLRCVHEAPDRESALSHLVRFTTAVGDIPAVWAMLGEHPHAARLLIYLFGSSPPLARQLSQDPQVFERLIYSASARPERTQEKIDADLKSRLRTTEDRARRMGRIRRFHQEELLRIALHEVAGAVPVEATLRQLSALAEVVLRALFQEVVDEYSRQEEGLFEGADPVEELGLALFAMGKLGAREMGFGSDLDFIFVYQPAEQGGLDHEQATGLARRLVHALSAATDMGGLYEVDLRLRPSGSKGRLVVSIGAWRAYHDEQAELWERQALIRARALTGTGELREALEEGRRELVFERDLPGDAREKVVEMRRRLDEVARVGDGEFDVKYSRGGLLDVEFLTQWLQLVWRGEGAVQEARATGEALEVLQELEPALDLAGLRRDYLWLRRLESRLQISGLGTNLPSSGAVRRALIRQMGHQGRGGEHHFARELAGLRQRVQALWRQVFEGL